MNNVVVSRLLVFLCMLALLALCLPVHALADGYILARVVKVYDGDTIQVRLASGTKEKVRLIGIDCPEALENEKFARDMKRERRHTPKQMLELGRRAEEYTETLCPPGAAVRLEIGVERRDRYGRLLAYVWVHNPLSSLKPGEKGWDMLNEELLRAGLARPMVIPPNVEYEDDFRQLEREARGRRLGIWAK